MKGDQSPSNQYKSDSSSIFNNSTISAPIGGKSPYWDLLSLDDVREHDKEVKKKREAELMAHKQLKSCLEGQMREKYIQKDIDRHNSRVSQNELLLDKMKILEQDHILKVNFRILIYLG